MTSLLAEFQRSVAATPERVDPASGERPGPGWFFGRHSNCWLPPIPGYGPDDGLAAKWRPFPEHLYVDVPPPMEGSPFRVDEPPLTELEPYVDPDDPGFGDDDVPPAMCDADGYPMDDSDIEF